MLLVLVFDKKNSGIAGYFKQERSIHHFRRNRFEIMFRIHSPDPQSGYGGRFPCVIPELKGR